MLDSNGYDHKDMYPVIAVIKITTSKGPVEIFLRENTNIQETADRLVAYGGLKADMKAYLEGYLVSKQ